MKQTELEYAEMLIKSNIGLGYETAVWIAKKDVTHTIEAINNIADNYHGYQDIRTPVKLFKDVINPTLDYYQNVLQILKDKL